MNTRFSCNVAMRSARKSTRYSVMCLGVLSAITPMVSGCMSSGKLLYAMGFGSAPMIEAQFLLTDEPILIFIDDIHERVDWPLAQRYVFDELSQALLRNEAAKKIIPIETLDQLRQTVEDFDKRGCREIGERAGATQVLWIEVKDFLADEQIAGADNAAYMTVGVKVIDVTQKKSRTRVRLWPKTPAGKFVAVNLSGAETTEAKDKKGITKKLAAELADSIAKLFYDYRADDFEHSSH